MELTPKEPDTFDSTWFEALTEGGAKVSIQVDENGNPDLANSLRGWYDEAQCKR